MHCVLRIPQCEDQRNVSNCTADREECVCAPHARIRILVGGSRAIPHIIDSEDKEGTVREGILGQKYRDGR